MLEWAFAELGCVVRNNVPPPSCATFFLFARMVQSVPFRGSAKGPSTFGLIYVNAAQQPLLVCQVLKSVSMPGRLGH